MSNELLTISKEEEILIPLVPITPFHNSKRKHKSLIIKGNSSKSIPIELTSSTSSSQNQDIEQCSKKNFLNRYSDGYFRNQQSEELFNKKSLLRLTLGVHDENDINAQEEEDSYRKYDTIKMPQRLCGLLIYCHNIFMQQFSDCMRYFGSKVSALESKYSSANVGYVMMAVSTILHVIPTIYVKCNPQIDYSIALMSRGLVTMFMVACMASVKSQPLSGFCKNDMIILTIRALLAAIPQLYFFFAVTKLPLSLNYVVFNTGPIFVFLLSAFLFAGTVHRREIFGIIIAIIGMIAVTNPSIFTQLLSTIGINLSEEASVPSAIHQKARFEYSQGLERIIYTFFFVLVYVGWAYGILIVKKLKEANTFATNYFVAIACFLSGLASFYARGIEFPSISAFDIFCLISVVGIFSFGSQYTFITSTFLNHNHGPLSMLNYLSVVESYIVQIIFFGEVPSVVEIIGSLLVLLGLAKILIH